MAFHQNISSPFLSFSPIHMQCRVILLDKGFKQSIMFNMTIKKCIYIHLSHSVYSNPKKRKFFTNNRTHL